MKNFLINQLKDPLIGKLKKLAAQNGVSAGDQYRHIWSESLKSSSQNKEPLATYLIKNPVCPDVEIPLERSRDFVGRDEGI